MACFTACVAEALVVFGVKKTIEKKHPTLSKKLTTLIYMLLSGSLLLMVEHIYHGEITYLYPFLTALKDPADTQVMLKEIVTVGVCMDLVMTALWAIYYKVFSFKKAIEVKA